MARVTCLARVTPSIRKRYRPIEFLLSLGLLHVLLFVIVVCNKENVKQSSDFDVKRKLSVLTHIPVFKKMQENAYKIVQNCRNVLVTRIPVNAQMDVFKSVKYVQKSKIVDIIAINNGYTSKILGQNVRIRPPFWILTEALLVTNRKRYIS